MKKILIVLLVIISFLLVSCNTNSILKENISYIELCKQVGESEDYHISIVKAKGGLVINSTLDSKPSMEESVLVIVTPKKLGIIDKSLNIVMDGTSYVLIKSKLKATLECIVPRLSSAKEVSIILDKVPQTISLTTLSYDNKQLDNLLDIAVKELAISNSDKKTKIEVIIKILEDTHFSQSHIFYIGIIRGENDYSAILLKPNGEIIAKKTLAS